jgi:deoxyribodipyrimidine photo-lyase
MSSRQKITLHIHTRDLRPFPDAVPIFIFTRE